jgi:hypothetical protein
METQQVDGSWYVSSRAVRFQQHFESGFPYGKDQFLSSAATSWAAMALMLSTPHARKPLLMPTVFYTDLPVPWHRLLIVASSEKARPAITPYKSARVE